MFHVNKRVFSIATLKIAKISNAAINKKYKLIYKVHKILKLADQFT